MFITGRVQANVDENGKLICEKITPFSEVPRTLWIRMPDEQTYHNGEKELTDMLKDLDGKDGVIIYCEKEKSRLRWPASRNICINSQLIDDLRKKYGNKNVETT